MSLPDSDPSLTFLPVISTAAVADDEAASRTATEATTSEGEGRRITAGYGTAVRPS